MKIRILFLFVILILGKEIRTLYLWKKAPGLIFINGMGGTISVNRRLQESTFAC